MRLDPRDTVRSSALRSSLKSWPELQIRITRLTREGSPHAGLGPSQAKLSRNSNQRGRIRRFESYMPSQAVGLQQPNAGQFRRPRPLRSHPRRLQGVPALYPQRWRTARLDRARDHRRRLRLPCARVEIWTGHQRLERCTVRRWLPDCLGSTFRWRLPRRSYGRYRWVIGESPNPG
jgi:hypothetical protein